MKKISLFVFVLCLLVISLTGCNKKNESYLAHPDRYTYEKDDYYSNRYLYKDNPIPLCDGSSLYYYVQGSSRLEDGKVAKNPDYSESYVIVQPSVFYNYNDETISHHIWLDKCEFDSFVLAVKNLKPGDSKKRALRETFLTILKERSDSWTVNPATKSIEAFLGLNLSDLLETNSKNKSFKSFYEKYPFNLTLHYDLFTDELTVDVYIIYSEDKYLNIKEINIASDFNRFSYTDFIKSDIKRGNLFIERVLVESYESISKSMATGSLPQSLGSEDIYINFIGEKNKESISHRHASNRYLLDNLASIGLVHRAMIKGEIDPLFLAEVSSFLWHYSPVLDRLYY